MKFTTILILVGCLQVSAKGYSQKISIDVKSSPFEQIFKEIEKQSGYSFIYAKEQAVKFKAIDFKTENTEIITVLTELFKDTEFRYTISGKNIVISERPILISENKIALPPPPFIVTGKVVNEEGKALVGASVFIKTTTKGTTTKNDGSFSIEVPAAGATLVFSYIGQETVEIKVTNATNLSVKLKAIAASIEDFVVIGYQKIKKSDVTGAVSQIKPEGVSERPNTSVEQLIQGRVSGVQVQSANGAPGAGLSILIRGGNSTSSNQPLYVIDGYPVDAGNGDLQTGGNNQAVSTPPTNPLANLNPNEIESIEILKDASSTAIYGSRGANGVILITTKRGKKGNDKIEFSYRSDFNNVMK